MINLLRRFLFNRNRKIFRFWNGRRVCWADPVECWRELLADEHFDMARDAALMELPERVVADVAWVKCVNAVRRVFHVSTADDGGLTESECVDLFRAFCVYVHALKKNSNPTPTQSPPSAGPRPTSGTPSDTRDGLGCTSTPTASDCGPRPSFQAG